MSTPGMARRDFILRTAFAAGATAFLAACGASGDDDGGAAAPGPTTTPPTSMPPRADGKWWLEGNFAPIDTEIETTELVVHGEIPDVLQGLYVRNGSNPVPKSSPHWFLGDGMLHGVMLGAGSASWYRNRYVKTALYDLGGGLAAAGAPGGASSLSNVSMIHHAGKLLSLGEVGLPYAISPADLTTIGVHDFGGAVKGNVTAHPKIDPATGRMHFFGYGFTEPFLMYYVAEADGTLLTAEPVAVGAASMIHDFAITDRDVIFWEMPVLFDFDLAIEMVATPDSDIMPYVWTPSYGSRIGIMPLGGPASAIRWVEIDNCYVFHGVNAFRNGDDVVIDVSRLEHVFNGGALGTPPALHRWTVNTAGAALTFTDDVLSDRPADLPSVDRRSWGREYRHSWRVEVGDATDTVDLRGVVHYDTKTGREQRWDPGAGNGSGEWLFVPSGDDEGDGFLLTYTYDAAEDTSALVILDAQDVGAGPVGRVEIPQRVPYGFHAAWVPATEI